VLATSPSRSKVGGYALIWAEPKLGENWAPRELRHSFVSIMSDNGAPIETIADLVGHASTAVTEEVYRHQLKPVITKDAATMNALFNQQNHAKSA
jgi:integrase